MAIAHDADSNAGSTIGNVSTFSWSHTVTGSNPILVVGIFGNTGSSGYTVSGVTYNGVSLTVQQTLLASSAYLTWIGYLIGPSTGTNTIQVTLSTAAGSGGPNVFAGATSFTGVDQVNPIDSAGTTQAGTSASTVTLNVTTANANAWIVDVVADKYNNGTPTANSPQVAGYRSPNFAGSINGGTSYQGPVATPASTSDTWTVAGGGTQTAWSLAAFSINPLSAATSPPFGWYSGFQPQADNLEIQGF